MIDSRKGLFFKEKREQLEKSHALRELRVPFGVDYSSNDYLGLAENPLLQKKVRDRLSQTALGSGGSRLIRGHSENFENLEKELADFSGQEGALFFATGYQANVALLSCLPKKTAVVFSDELNHASIIDGIRLSGCEKHIWAHNNLGELEMLLKWKARPDGLNVVVVESLYSMRGDQAPLRDILELCKTYGAELIVDEAHATGLFGARGSGLVDHNNLSDSVFATIHTAGKSLGVSGAWVAGSHDLIEYMINSSRPFIYSTAPAVFQQWALAEALDFFQEHKASLQKNFFKGLSRFEKLMTSRFEDRFLIYGKNGPITSLVLKENKKALQVMESLREAGFDARAIRPPTVPQGEALLRLTHPLPRTPEQDLQLVCCLEEILCE